MLLAGATEGFRDAIGTESRFYHPTGLVASHRSQALYIADSHNHLIRVMNLTDRNVVEQLATDEWDEVLSFSHSPHLPHMSRPTFSRTFSPYITRNLFFFAGD